TFDACREPQGRAIGRSMFDVHFFVTVNGYFLLPPTSSVAVLQQTVATQDDGIERTISKLQL
ncbi:MAG: hypothetical protein JW883_13965, partial [Deltaproteobacteria bacterium]|nr:hypothetical protein [Deltaproteobacteria bacterium]